MRDYESNTYFPSSFLSTSDDPGTYFPAARLISLVSHQNKHKDTVKNTAHKASRMSYRMVSSREQQRQREGKTKSNNKQFFIFKLSNNYCEIQYQHH